jgi:preprotein translocase subunit SecA
LQALSDEALSTKTQELKQKFENKVTLDALTFVTDNQAIIFRAQKQNTVLLNAIKQVKSLTHIEKVVVKIDLKRPLHK